MTCAICEVRKPKRFCPAVHGRICPQCCGEQREVALDCPSECVYLQQARIHEKPRAAPDFEQSALFPQVRIEQQFLYQQEPLITGITFALVKSARANRDLHDPVVIAALSAMCSSYETLVNSGLHYGLQTNGLAHQAVIAEIQAMIKEYRETEHRHLGYNRLRDSDLLRALVFLLRMAYARTSGRPKSRAFIDFASAQFPEQASPLSATGSIIIP